MSKEDKTIISKIVQFILDNIGVKLDAHKFKKFNDLGFVLIEKTVINLDKLVPSYLGFYDNMIENEISLAGISSKDKVLHIGCGPMPATSILIVKKTGAHFTCIDKNIHSVEKAKILIKKLKFDGKIQIIHTVAADFSLEKYNLIIVSQGINPYFETLEYISKAIKDDTKVIFRTSSSIDGKLADKDNFLKDLFTISNIVYQKKNSLLISILLLKK